MLSSRAGSAALLVSEFVTRLTAAIEEAANERARRAVLSALGGAHAAPPAAAGRPRSSGRKGGKRVPADIAATTEKLAAYIAKNPGKRMEEIGRALGTETRLLALSVKKLAAARRITTQGQKRATKYFAAGAAKPSAAAKTPAPRRKPAKATRKATPKAAKPAKAASKPKAARKPKAATKAKAPKATPKTTKPAKAASKPKTARKSKAASKAAAKPAARKVARPAPSAKKGTDAVEKAPAAAAPSSDKPTETAPPAG